MDLKQIRKGNLNVFRYTKGMCGRSVGWAFSVGICEIQIVTSLQKKQDPNIKPQISKMLDLENITLPPASSQINIQRLNIINYKLAY